MSATPWRLAALITMSTGLVYSSTAGGSLATKDAVAVFAQAKSLVDHGRLDVPPHESNEGLRGRDGRYYLPFGIGQTLYDVPFLLMGRAAGRASGWQFGDADALPKAFVAYGSTGAAAAAVGFGFLLAWRLSGSVAASVVAATALAFGTLLWPYSKFGFNAALAAASLSAGVYGIAAGGHSGRLRAFVAGGAALGFAFLTRHELLLAGLAAVAWVAARPGISARTRVAAVAAAGGGLAAAAVIWCTLNLTHFGRPFFSGHEPEFTGAGFAAFLWSPSGALWLYSPVALSAVGLIGLCRTVAMARLLLAVLATLVLFYAALDDWLGTRSYGPRYLVPLLPLMTAPFAGWWMKSRGTRRALLITLTAISVLVQIPAVAVDFSRAGVAAGQPPQNVRRDQWEWTPIGLNLRYATTALPESLGSLAAGGERRPTGAAGTAEAGDTLDFWWLYLYEMGKLSAAVSLAAGLIPAILGVALLARVHRRSRPANDPGSASASRVQRP